MMLLNRLLVVAACLAWMATLTACSSPGSEAPPPSASTSKGAPAAPAPTTTTTTGGNATASPTPTTTGGNATTPSSTGSTGTPSATTATATTPGATTGDAAAPTFSEPTAEQQALLEGAEKAMDDANVESAVKAFELLSKSEPMSGLKLTGMIALSDLYLQGGEPARAVTILEEARRRAPPRPEVLFVLGRAYAQSKKPSYALKAYEEALKLQPLLLRAYVEIGGLYTQIGKEDHASEAMLNYERQVYKYAKLLEAPDTHPTDKFRIVEAFSMLPDDRVNQALVRAMDDATPVIRLAAVEALGEVGSADVVPALREALKKATANKDEVTAKMIRQSIARITETPLPEGVDDGPRKDGKVGPTFVKPGDPSTAPIDPKAGQEEAPEKPTKGEAPAKP